MAVYAPVNRLNCPSVEAGAGVRLWSAILLRVRPITCVVTVAKLYLFTDLPEEGLFSGDARIELVGPAALRRRIGLPLGGLLSLAVAPEVSGQLRRGLIWSVVVDFVCHK